jgi:dTDP-4-amino-4,6-dideoxygalactose transaminase
LQGGDIESGIHYPDPVHLTPAFADLGYKSGSFPVAERIAREELSLPMFPGLRREAIEHVAHILGSEGDE